jgi:hypothetical protein
MHTTHTTENPPTRNLPNRFLALKARLATWHEAACRRIARGGTPLVVSVCTFMVVYGHPILAFAQDEEGERRDARLEGYATKVAMDTGGLGLTWIAFILLAVIGVSALFKSAKRSHLD